MTHVDLAADLDDVGPARPRQLQRDVLDRLQVRGDILPGLTVAPRRADGERAVLVSQRGRQAVDFRLGGEGERFASVNPEKPADPFAEFGDLFIRERVAQRKHGHGMGHLVEFFRRRRADPRGRTVRPDQVGKAPFYGSVTGAQSVVPGIRNGRRVILIVAPVMLGHLKRDPLKFSGRRVFIEAL